MAQKPRDMTSRHERFLEEYFAAGCNGAEAFRRIEPAAKNPRRKAFDLIRRSPALRKAIEARQAELARMAKADAEEVITRLSIVGRANIKAYLNGDWSLKPLDEIPEDLAYAILEHEETTTTRGAGENAVTVRTVRIRLKDSLSALDKLAKTLGLFKGDENPNNVNVLALIQNNLHLQDMSSDDLRLLAAVIRKKLPEGEK